MIPFFVGYALIVWFGICRYRRTFRGWVWLVAGVTLLLFINWLHYNLNDWTGGQIYFAVLQAILYPYTAGVLAVGLFIVCLPRRFDQGCHRCGYDLDSLDNPERCPECGTPTRNHPETTTYRPSGLPRESLRGTDIRHPNTTRHARPNTSTPAGSPTINAHR